MSLREYAKVLSSKEAVPGGGGAAALVGALGCSLGSMTGELTSGKKKFADVEPLVRESITKLCELRDKLMELSEKDAEVFEPLSKAYSLPKDTEEEREYKDKVMEECLDMAASVPMEIMRCACLALEPIKTLSEVGSKLAVSDAGCAASLCKSAVVSASLNVYINTRYMKDREKAEALNEETRALVDKACSLADEVTDSVSAYLESAI